MNIISPLQIENRTIIYVTDTSPITKLTIGSKIPMQTLVENRNEKIAYHIGGYYLVDYTEGNSWCEGSIVLAKGEQ